MITGILIAAALVGGTGLVIGLLLGVAGKKFAVEVNEKEIAVREQLPGNIRLLISLRVRRSRKSTGKWLSGRRKRSGKSHCSYHGRRDKRRTPHDSLCKMCGRL